MRESVAGDGDYLLSLLEHKNGSWLISHCAGHNMSVLGSQVDVDMDESVPDPVPKHQGHTGTGCYKLHDHEFMRPKHRVSTKAEDKADKGPPTNIMDLPVDSGGPQQAVQQLKHIASPAHRSPVREEIHVWASVSIMFWNGLPQNVYHQMNLV